MTSAADAFAQIKRGADEILVESELEERLKEGRLFGSESSAVEQPL